MTIAAFARDDRNPSQGRTPDSLVTKDQYRALHAGLAWISSRRQSGGSWGTKEGTQVADTSLSLLALMAGGNTLGPGKPDRQGLVGGPTRRGPYAADVEAGIDFLARLACRTKGGDPAGYIHDDALSLMHGHGFATLALATASGNLGSSRIGWIRERVKEGAGVKDLSYADRVRWGLELAVRLTEDAQDRDTGGWYYNPYPEGHEGSMTVTQITALRAAMEAGVKVNGGVMKHAYEYVRESQNTTHRDYIGGFAYQKNQKERVSVALTSAALTTLFGLGRYGEASPEDSKLIASAMDYLDRHFSDDALTTHMQWYYYRLFYLAQALYLSGDAERFARYWPAIRDDVISRQQADGRFGNEPDPDRSDEYCTAMGCLILEVPMETLPIFQRR